MSTKIGLAISTVLLVGAAGASISSLLTQTPKTYTTVVEKSSISSVTGKVDGVRRTAVKNIAATADDAVLLDTEVDRNSVNATINSLEAISKEGKEISLLIDSPGGSVIDGARLIAYMESSKAKINTVCIGLCASMAAHIHQAGAKRLIQDKAILMFHPASGGARGTMNEMLGMLNMLNTYCDRMDAMLHGDLELSTQILNYEC